MQGITLSIDTNQFYMEGFSGVIHPKAENPAAEPCELVDIEVAADIAAKNKSFYFRLVPGKSKERRSQLDQIKSRGPKVVSFKLHVTKVCHN